MLGQRRRRWTKIESILGERLRISEKELDVDPRDHTIFLIVIHEWWAI